MLVFQIITACVLYAVIGGIVYFIFNKLINDEAASAMLAVFWPVGTPLLILFGIASATIKILKLLESKINK